MNGDGQHSERRGQAALAALDALADLVADRVVERVGVLRASEPPRTIDNGGDRLQWDRYYSARTLAERWDMTTDDVHAISEALLPRQRQFGQRRVRFLGLDVLRFEHLIDEQTYHALQKKRKPVLEDSPEAPPRLWRLGDALDARNR